MNNFFEDLKKYFEETPREKYLADWAKSVEFDNVGPTVDEFLSISQQYSVISADPNEGSQQDIIIKCNPKYSSGFFFTNNIYSYAKCSVFNS